MRQYGTARDDEELELGVRCMAAGILDDQGKLVAGLSISAPADRLEESWLERLRATAAQISARPRAPRAERASDGAAARPRQSGGLCCGSSAAGTAAGTDAVIQRRTRSASPMRRVLAGRIEEHHDQLAAGDLGLHHQAAAGFGDVAGLLQADLPLGVLHQTVGVAELERAVADRDHVLGRGRELADERIFVARP